MYTQNISWNIVPDWGCGGGWNDKFNPNTKLIIISMVHCDSLSHTSVWKCIPCLWTIETFCCQYFYWIFVGYIFSNVWKQVLLLFGWCCSQQFTSHYLFTADSFSSSLTIWGTASQRSYNSEVIRLPLIVWRNSLQREKKYFAENINYGDYWKLSQLWNLG